MGQNMLMERRVHALLPDVPSERASWDPDEDAIVRDAIGEVVPIPTLPAASMRMRSELPVLNPRTPIPAPATLLADNSRSPALEAVPNEVPIA